MVSFQSRHGPPLLRLVIWVSGFGGLGGVGFRGLGIQGLGFGGFGAYP